MIKEQSGEGDGDGPTLTVGVCREGRSKFLFKMRLRVS